MTRAAGWLEAIAVQRIATTADRNGNSRAVWLFYDPDGKVAAGMVEYYNKPKEAVGLAVLPEFKISPGEWRALVKEHGKR